MVKAKKARTWEYVLLEDRASPEEEQTVWTLQTLPQRALTRLADSSDITQDEDGRIRTHIKLGTQNEIALLDGIAGVRNFADRASGEAVPFPVGGPTPRPFLERLELGWQRELAAEILRGGGPLAKDEVEKPAPSHTG